MRSLKALALLLKWWIYWYPFRFFVQIVPLSVNYRLANILVLFLYVFFREDRRRIEEGLEMAYKGEILAGKKKEIVLNTFRNILYSAIEVLWYPGLTKENCEKMFSIIGKENLDKALLEEKGVVLLHGHFGNAHLIMPAIGHMGYRLNQVASRKPPARLPGFFGYLLYKIRMSAYKAKLGYKKALPVDFIYTDRSVREIFRRLHNNEVVAIGIDGREGSNGVEFDFLGGRAIFFPGIMKLLQKAKPVVLPIFHIRNSDGSHKIVIENPLGMENTGKEEDVIRNTGNFLKILESHIYDNPDHYARVFCLRQQFFVSPWSNV